MYIALAALGCIGLMTRAAVSVLVALLAVGWFGWGTEATAAAAAVLRRAAHRHTRCTFALWFFSGSALWLWREHISYRIGYRRGSARAAVVDRGDAGGNAGRPTRRFRTSVLWTAQLQRRMDESFRAPR